MSSATRPVDALVGGGQRAASDVPWLQVAQGSPSRGDAEPRTGRVLGQVGLAAALVIALVAGGSVVLARRLAEREAVNHAVQATDLLAETVVQRALDDAPLPAEPSRTATLDESVAVDAQQRLGNALSGRVLAAAGLIRIKLWSADGTIVYSNEPRLIARRYDLEQDERAVLLEYRTEAGITDLTRPENAFERGQGKLFEVYRPVWTRDGRPLLFETYSPYATLSTATSQMWRGIAGLLLSSLLLLVVLLLPLLGNLVKRLRRAQRQREALLHRAVDSSASERQRIAASLHDGVVQELVATSYAVSAAAERSTAAGDPGLAQQLRVAGQAVRTSLGGLRSLLVDIYPPSLHSDGLPAALTDLTAVARSRQLSVELDLPSAGEPTGLDTAGERLVFRVAQETLRNAVAHSRASTLGLHLHPTPEHVVLEITDNGIGFDPSLLDSGGAPGHFGLRLLPDLARHGGATLLLATAAGCGTRWRLEVPTARHESSS